MSSTDPRGNPNFIWAVGDHHAEPADDARTAAERHLTHFAKALNLSARDLDTATLQFARQIGAGGYIVKFQQQINGVSVYPSAVTVLMRSNLDLVAITGHLEPVKLANGSAAQELSIQQAVATALTAQLRVPISDTAIIDLDDPRAELRRFRLAAGNGATMREAAVRRIYFAGGKELEPAYFIEFYGSSPNIAAGESDAFRYIISSRDGSVLQKRDLTAYDAFTYRVWAETGGNSRPYDGPIEDVSPHPTGIPDFFVPALVPSNLVTMEGFNKNPDGVADPWLFTGAGETIGNNVDAYTDDDTPDGYSNGDLRATTTAPGVFDRTFDFNIDANATEDQSMAAVTELFYVTNWLHDWWYDSGFNEAAGNAQTDNFERGGAGGDVMHAEAQDGLAIGQRNNANMSTPSDGLSPRMQMFQWTAAEARFILSPAGPTYIAGTAAFGATDFDFSADLVLADDGVGAPSDACTTLQGNIYTGRIVLADRGSCTFVLKVLNAQAAGAVGVIVANNAPSPTPPTLGGVEPSIVIGALSVTQADGVDLKTRLLAGNVNGRFLRVVHPDRDGTQDHSVVAHEWGHYFHHRLADCGSPACRGMSEGWGDWNALYMSIREGDDPNGVYAAAVYATRTFGDATYFGIRRTPYSVDQTKDGLSFRHIQDGEPPPSSPFSGGGVNSEVHNAGEVWCTMMHEAYMSLIRQVDGTPGAPVFGDMQRRMADYVVASLQATPLDATHLEARDALLAVAYASGNTADLSAMTQAFASRGAGSCAVAPPRYSTNLVGVVESNEVRPRVLINNVSFDQSIHSCDNDGVLDAEEIGNLWIQVSNPSPQDLSDLVLTVTASEAGVLFPAGNSVQVAPIAPFATQTIELQVGLDPTYTGIGSMTIGVHATSNLACEQTTTTTVVARVNFDTTNGGSTTDDVESPNSRWASTAADVWARTEIEPLSFALHGIDPGRDADERLESPSLNVSGTDPFVISYDNRYSFEYSNPTFWDGGFLEISPDDGVTWNDLSVYVDPHYDGTLEIGSGNPQGGRLAFASTSSAWPMNNHVVYDLGTQLAGQTVRVRFRIASDQNTGDYGWDIDNVHFDGITNAPFDELIDDATICPPNLVANAGPDQTVDPKQVVLLDGTLSASFDQLPLTYAWTQASGPAVTLTGADTSHPIFAAPEVGASVTLTFELAVNDGSNTVTDTVDIIVRESEALVAIAGNDQTVEAHAIVVLDGSASRTAPGLPLTYTWVQTSGPTVTLSGTNNAVARFEAPASTANETFAFQLTVSDGTRMATDAVTIFVNASGALAANAGPDQTVATGAVVVLDGSASNSASNLPLTFSWAKTSGPDVTLENAATAVARFTAAEATAGMMIEFTLTVSDGIRTQTDSVKITVTSADVVADAGMNKTVDSGASVALDGSASHSSSGRALTYTWSQTAGANVTLSNASGAATTFTAPTVNAMATLTFKLVVADGAKTAEDTVEVIVRPAAVTPPVEDDCGCTTTESHRGGTASVLMSLAALAFIVSRKRR